MTYAVAWALAAVQELARLERVAADPAAVRAAANAIDYALRRTPRDVGESRRPGWRLWYGDILGVCFYVDEARMRVEVHAVGPARRR